MRPPEHRAALLVAARRTLAPAVASRTPNWERALADLQPAPPAGSGAGTPIALQFDVEQAANRRAGAADVSVRLRPVVPGRTLHLTFDGTRCISASRVEEDCAPQHDALELTSLSPLEARTRPCWPG